MPRLTELYLVTRTGLVGCDSLCDKDKKDDCLRVIKRFLRRRKEDLGHNVPDLIRLDFPRRAEPGRV